MFDLRYHVASLAAVFIALAVGIVIGVAIAGGGNLEETTQGLRQADFDDLEQRLEDAQARVDERGEGEAGARRSRDEGLSGAHGGTSGRQERRPRFPRAGRRRASAPPWRKRFPTPTPRQGIRYA